MKIESGRSITPSGTARRPGAAAAPGFAPTSEATVRTAAVSSVSAVTPLDAIIALQAEGSPGERRARQARRGRDALDALDKLVQGLVVGRAPAGLKGELEALRRRAEPSGEAGLDAILLEIDTRVEVELAKLEMTAGRA
jgi:hypothetical protein